MLKKELLKLIENIKEDEDIDGVIEKSELANKLGSLDVFKNKIEYDKEFKSLIDSIKDHHLTKGIETWKTNNLQKLIDEKVKDMYPDEDPKDIELTKLKKEMESMKKEKIKEQLTNKALKIATEKGLPTDLVDFFIGQDEENTNKNLETLEKVFTEKLESTVKERFKDNSYTPPNGSNDPQGGLDFISVIKENQVKRD